MPVDAPGRAVDQERPLGADGRRAVPAQGPQGRGLRPRHDPRGDHLHPGHRSWSPTASCRRCGTSSRPSCATSRGPRPADAHPRVHHEGLLQLRPGPRPGWTGPLPRTATPTCGSSSGCASRPSRPTRPAAAMGGSDSTEFICPSPSGEDLIVLCPECGYAANIEKAMSRLAAVDDSERAGLLAAPEPFATPGVRTIEDLAVQYQAPADQQIKTLVYFLDDVLTLVLLRGDHALNEQKLADATGAVAIRPAQPEEIRDALGALPGSLGAVGGHSSLAGHRRRGAARPARHVHRRQHRRHPPARRGRRARHRRGPVGRPARGGGRRRLRELRARPGGRARHRGRAHLQAGLQVLRRHGYPGVRPGRQAGQADHGLLRHRRRARHGHGRRGPPRRQGHHLAGRDRPVRRSWW